MIFELKSSVIANVPPSYAANPDGSALTWLKAKRNDDNVEDGMWRINNTLYDLRCFVDKHPGGADWIRLTKGQDITEAFNIHHLNLEKVEPFLKKYRIRDTTLPRNVKLTFDENGFYMTLKRKVAAKLPEIMKRTKVHSKLYIDGLFILSILTAILAHRYQSMIFASICGLFYAWCGISGHNFLHQRDNFRMKYFNILLTNYRDFRVSHALSHHVYPNSLLDYEMFMVEPFFVWRLTDQKTWIQRYGSFVYAAIIYAIFLMGALFKRVHSSLTKENALYLDDCLPLIFPISMFLCGGNHSLFEAFKMYALILLIASFVFSIIGFNAGHHHPEVSHDGDKIRDGYDWGIFTIDSIMERQELKGNKFLALTNFGDHALHHLFPTLDHAVLTELYDILFETLLEFEAELQCYPWFFETIKGQFKQMSRTKPMEISSHERYLLKNGLKSKLLNGKPLKNVQENVQQ